MSLRSAAPSLLLRGLALVVAEADGAAALQLFAEELEALGADFLAADGDHELHPAVGLETIVAAVPAVEAEALDEGLLAAVVHEGAHVLNEATRALLDVVEEDVELQIARRTIEAGDHLGLPLAIRDGRVRGLSEAPGVVPAGETEQGPLRATPGEPLLDEIDPGSKPPLSVRFGGGTEGQDGSDQKGR